MPATTLDSTAAVSFSAQYKAKLFQALETVDLETVGQVIDILRRRATRTAKSSFAGTVAAPRPLHTLLAIW